MKLKSLILGSVAAAGLSTAGYAADLGVLTSLDVCDALGISGLTISSDTNCLQISGGVDYRLRIGDYRRDIVLAGVIDEDVTAVGDDSFEGEELDWDTRTRAWLRVVGTSDSDFGPASAVIGLRQVDEWRVRNGGEGTGPANDGVVAGGDTTDGVILDEAYVSIGDTTVITIGLRREGAAGSVANFSDDEPFSYLFSAQDAIDGDGILVNNDDDRFGGVVMQATTDVGNGISVAVGLENITNTLLRDDRNTADQSGLGSVGAGTLVGVVSYAGESISAHLTAAKFGVLDDEGEVVPGSGISSSADGFLIHAGASGTFDAFSARVALGYEDNYKFNDFDVLSGLASVQGEFDLFTLAVSGEFQSFDQDDIDQTDFGLSALASAQVTEGVSINLEGTWFRDDVNTEFADLRSTDSYRVVLSAAADISETIAVTAGVGTWFGDGVITSDAGDDNVIYGVVGASWTPSDDFDAAVELQANDDGGYRGQFTASKTFD